MPLVAPDTLVLPATLRAIYSEHREEIDGLRRAMETPTDRVTNEARLMLARQLAADVLAVLPARAESVPDAAIGRWVNVSYDVMVTVIELYRTSLDRPITPRRRG